MLAYNERDRIPARHSAKHGLAVRGGSVCVALALGVVLVAINRGSPYNGNAPIPIHQVPVQPAYLGENTALIEAFGPKPGTKAGAEFVGEVVAVGDGILIVMAGEMRRMYFVNKETQITLNRRPARLEDIMPGHSATVFSEQQGEQHIVKAVDAMMNY